MTAPVLSAVAEPVNLHIVQGADFEFWVVLGPENAPINLTGVTAEAHIRRHPLDPSPLAAFEITITPLEGRLVLRLTDADTTAVPAVDDPSAKGSRSVWDLVIQDTLGRKIQILRGDVRGYLKVTHAD
jgi:hypothetical protein